MRSNKTLTLALLLLIIVAALYRVIPERPMGFAPQLAMALFAGAVVKDRKWAFALPIFSMFVSDLLYQLLYIKGLTAIPGFYAGQITNYLLFAGMVAVGFFVRRTNAASIALFSVAECVIFFISSNFFVWASGAGLARPKTFSGLVLCYTDALPFFGNSLVATLLFSGVLFGSYQLLALRTMAPAVLASK